MQRLLAKSQAVGCMACGSKAGRLSVRSLPLAAGWGNVRLRLGASLAKVAPATN